MTPTPALNAALAKVQARLPKLERDRIVTVQTKSGEPYSYSYATLANLSEAVLPLLAEHGLSFTALPGSGSDGKFRLNYHLLHESGEALSGEFPLSGEGGIQQLGGRITYARRYCLAAVVGIAADEDDEARLGSEAPPTAQRAQKKDGADKPATARRSTTVAPPLPGEQPSPDAITQPQLSKLHAVFGQIGWSDRDDRLRAASLIVGRPLESSSHLTKDDASKLIDELEQVAQNPDPSVALENRLRSIREGEGEA